MSTQRAARTGQPGRGSRGPGIGCETVRVGPELVQRGKCACRYRYRGSVPKRAELGVATLLDCRK